MKLDQPVNFSLGKPSLVRPHNIGIATLREPVVIGEPRGRFRLEFRGLSDARSSVDRDTRLRIVLPAALASRLWQQLGDNLTDHEEETGSASWI